MKEIATPTKEQVEALMNAVLSTRMVNLNSVQELKFKQACLRSYIDNPEASFSELKDAANIYLNYILIFPDLTL